MSQFAIFGAQDPNALMPRFDPVSRERRIDPNAPVVKAYLGGRPVVLARMDPRTRRPGDPSDLTVPLTVSRYQHALDIEHGYRPETWEPTPLVGMGSAETAVWLGATAAVGGALGAATGAAIGGISGLIAKKDVKKRAIKGARVGFFLGLPSIALLFLAAGALATTRP